MKAKIRRKILVFSFFSSILVTALLIVSFLLITALPSYNESKNINLIALSSINCSDNVCNISDYINDWDIAYTPDYILTKNNFFIISSGFYPGFSLNYTDPLFFAKFEKPTTWESPAGETWRLYSAQKKMNQREAKVVVGWIEYTPSLLAETPATPEIDEALIQEANKIASQLEVDNDKIVSGVVKSKIDAFAIINAQSGEVIDWGGSIPAYLPEHVDEVTPIYINDNKDIFIMREDAFDRLRTVSLAYIVNLKWLITGILLMFLIAFFVSYFLCSTLLRKWFIFYGRRPVSLREALSKGEGQDLEFKRGFIDEDLLKTITAFANTNDGTIFIGVDDKGRVKGIETDTARARERLINKIFSLIRRKIKPSIHLSINFENLRGYHVVRLFTPRGEEPLYYFEGSIYVRHGDADVKAKPELVKKVLADYSF